MKRAAVEIVHLYTSIGHNYFGHHGRAAGEHTVEALSVAECVAGRGIRGDRFFDHQPDYKGQITFFAIEVYDSLCQAFQVWDRPPAAFRRNVITRGLDLMSLIEREFELGGVLFAGTGHCKPCYWMDQAFHEGAENALQGQGGLRAKILNDGKLRVGPTTLLVR